MTPNGKIDTVRNALKTAMKVVNKNSYNDYKKDKSFYDVENISQKDLAVLERFTPASGNKKEVYTCESLVLLSGEEVVNDRGESLGVLWTARSLIGVNPRTDKAIIERYDMLIYAVGQQAYRLTSETAEYADPGYHMEIISKPETGRSVYDGLCTATTIIDGKNQQTGKQEVMMTPSWFVAAAKLANPLLTALSE